MLRCGEDEAKKVQLEKTGEPIGNAAGRASTTATNEACQTLCNVGRGHPLSIMEATMYKNQSNLGYFLSGITMGAVAAIFLAPKSGPETCRDLRRRADESADYIKRRADEITRNATDVIDRGSRKIQSQMNTIVKSIAAVCR